MNESPKGEDCRLADELTGRAEVLVDERGREPSEANTADKAQAEFEDVSQLGFDGLDLMDATDQGMWFAFLSGC